MKKLSTEKIEYTFLSSAQKKNFLFSPFLLAVSGAIISSMAYDPFHLYLALPLGLAFLLKATDESKNWKEAAIAGLIYGFLFYLALCWWLGNVLGLYFLPFLLSFYEALFVTVAAAVSHYFFAKKDVSWRYYPMALLFFLSERLREVGEFSFPWANSGVIFAGTIFFKTLMVFGSIGLSFLIWVVTASLMTLLAKRSWKNLLSTFLLFITFLLPVAAIPKGGSDVRKISVTLAQENLTPEEKHEADPEKRLRRNLRSFLDLYQRLIDSKASLVVLPESSFPYDLSPGDFWFERFRRDSLERNKVIVLGATAREEDRYYNRAYIFDKGNVKIYDKRNLVPFGEYVPFRPLLNFIDAFVYKVDFARGRKSGVIKTSLGNIGIGICWESAIPGYGRSLAIDGAELLIFITNDNWYGKSSQNVQHWRHTIYQADSSGLSVVQSANVGITGYYYGGLSQRLPVWTHDLLVAKVPIRNPERRLLIFQSFFEKVTIAFSVIAVLAAYLKGKG